MTATETTVSYHRDGYGPARPAVNVKVYMFDHGKFEALDAALGSDSDLGQYPKRAERLYEIAQEQVYGQFWRDAEIMAAELGLGPIEQEGRSGGWLVLTDGRDPAKRDLDSPNAKEWAKWLAAYRQLAEWCAEQVSEAPARIARRARSLAIDEVAAGSVTLRSWLGFGELGEGVSL